jgi:hypothetical protein
MEGMWAKMFDPPTASPPTTDQLPLTPQLVPNGTIRPNPVPEVMAAAGLQSTPTKPHTLQRGLLHGLSIPTWDGKKLLNFFTFGDPDNPAAAGGTYPAATFRMPRGALFNGEVSGFGPPPHTIHWHGIEPTPINDGVGHCSMEIGHYTYQWQPNFTGFYFYHCHRNTMQHFEFGLFGAMIFETPDAYFASIASTNADGSVVLNKVPIGAGRDGKRRCAASLATFPQFPGWNSNLLTAPDPGPGPGDTQISFPTDPHAMTVPFDVEALWVIDDRDSVWSDLASNARATFPSIGTDPGINDQFTLNPGVNGFFAFNDFNADYWFVTGVPVPAPKGGTGTLPANVVIPPELNSGISGTQVSINAKLGDTVLVRCLCAAYNSGHVTFPVDVVIIAWDGRALGQPPFGMNEAYLVPKGTPIQVSTARRFDALIRETLTPVNDFVKVEFINTRGEGVPGSQEEIVVTAMIPINIGGTPVTPPTFAFLGQVVDELGAPAAGVSVSVTPKSLGAAPAQTVVTDANGKYTINGMVNGSYLITPSKSGHVFNNVNTIVTCNSQNVFVPNFVISTYTVTPGSYSLPEALDSLRSVVGLKVPTSTEKLRFDVAPIINGVATPDGKIDIRDALAILKMVVGLNP